MENKILYWHKDVFYFLRNRILNEANIEFIYIVKVAPCSKSHPRRANYIEYTFNTIEDKILANILLNKKDSTNEITKLLELANEQ